MRVIRPKADRLRLDPSLYDRLRQQSLRRSGFVLWEEILITSAPRATPSAHHPGHKTHGPGATRKERSSTSK